ncbi:hypothetical protein O181_071787 [Austropuccinia psidii MF-1]|uniref:Uncharacterized protein n=1 Tax=Austropuccinia psidii MF-1 TaxID=1389203 RepID=A0A9Q3F5U2_9BASI|nr:hypothetical protein [Austropuccinia psidii MF-1]
MGFKHHKQNQLNPPSQDYPVPSLPCKQTPWQATPRLSGTQWSEDLFRCPSQPSEPHEDAFTCEPEPDVAPTQSTEEPFSKSPLHVFYPSQLYLTPPLPISSLSGYTRLHNHHQQYAHLIPLPWRSRQLPPLIPTMRLGRNLCTCN